ncbi:MAG: pitrilysin family protein [Acidobacteriota bacterium]
MKKGARTCVLFIGLAMALVWSPRSLFAETSIPADGKSNATALGKLRKFELLNGLRIVIAERTQSSGLTCSLLVKAGSASDPAGKEGLSYLTARSLIYASQKKPAQRWKDELEDLGAQFAIHSDRESTVFSAELHPEDFRDYLETLRQMIVRPLLNPSEVERLKSEILQELEKSEPERGRNLLRSWVFGAHHPYGAPFRGRSDTVSGLNMMDVLDFHQTQYLPNDSALIVVGSMESAALMDTVREKLGGWIKEKKTEGLIPDVRNRERLEVRVIEDQSPGASVLFGHLGPARLVPDYYPIRILNLIVGGIGEHSRLVQTFRARGIPLRTLESHFRFLRTAGEFEIRVELSRTSALPALKAILASLGELKDGPVSESELEEAKAKLLEWHEGILSSDVRVAEQLAQMELYQLASDFLLDLPRRVSQVTAERVAEAAKSYLNTSSWFAILTDADGTPVESEFSQLGSVHIVRQRSLE